MYHHIKVFWTIKLKTSIQCVNTTIKGAPSQCYVYEVHVSCLFFVTEQWQSMLVHDFLLLWKVSVHLSVISMSARG